MLGSALADFVEFQGDVEAAVRIRRQMLEWDQRNPVLQTLDQRVREVLAGGMAQSPAEQLQLARRLAEQMQYEAAFKLCTAALEAEPSLVEDRQLQPRWLAASLAMRVAASPLPEEDASRTSTFRQQALQWLREELATWRASGPDWLITRNSAVRRWRSDASFAPVLHPDRLATLPEAGQQAWRQLFAAAAQLADSPPGSEPPHVE